MVIKEELEYNFIKWFSELNKESLSIAGVKGANLAESYNRKINVSPGFILTSEAYNYFIDKNRIREAINESLNALKEEDFQDIKKLEEVSNKIKNIFMNSKFPEAIAEQITENYEILDVNKKTMMDASGSALEILKKSYEPLFVAVRNSIVLNDKEVDKKDLSFAGIHDSFLNVKGNNELFGKIKECYASLFSSKALFYRHKTGVSLDSCGMAVIIQKMMDSDKSGAVIYDEISNSIVIESIFGFEEGLLSGIVKPDVYKITSFSDFEFDKKINEKSYAFIRNSSGSNEIVKVSEEKAKQSSLTNHEVKLVRNEYNRISEIFGKSRMDFTICGNEISILSVKKDKQERSQGVSSGKIKLVKQEEDFLKLENDDLLVTDSASSELIFGLGKAKGIISGAGGFGSNAYRLAKDFGIYCSFGVDLSSIEANEGDLISFDFDKNEAAKVEEDTKKVLKTSTKLKLGISSLNQIKKTSDLEINSIGFLQIEDIINQSGKHPIHFSKNKKEEEYFEIIYSALKEVADKYNELWIRSLNMKSNKFIELEGYDIAVENNPLMGEHGVRFNLKNTALLEAEAKAVQKISSEFEGKKFGIIFSRFTNLSELESIKKVFENVSAKDVKIGICVDGSVGVQAINEFCENGISLAVIDLEELIQHVLAVDKENELVSGLYDEMNPAIINSIKYVIRRCHKYGIESSIFINSMPKREFLQFVIQEGIKSVSFNADILSAGSALVNEIEKEVLKEKDVSEVKNVVSDSIHEGESKDIEELILKELEGDEYKPGMDKEKDIPKLNDAIPIDSSQF